jgi:hypothetical protein
VKTRRRRRRKVWVVGVAAAAVVRVVVAAWGASGAERGRWPASQRRQHTKQKQNHNSHAHSPRQHIFENDE